MARRRAPQRDVRAGAREVRFGWRARCGPCREPFSAGSAGRLGAVVLVCVTLVDVVLVARLPVVLVHVALVDVMLVAGVPVVLVRVALVDIMLVARLSVVLVRVALVDIVLVSHLPAASPVEFAVV